MSYQRFFDQSKWSQQQQQATMQRAMVTPSSGISLSFNIQFQNNSFQSQEFQDFLEFLGKIPPKLINQETTLHQKTNAEELPLCTVDNCDLNFGRLNSHRQSSSMSQLDLQTNLAGMQILPPPSISAEIQGQKNNVIIQSDNCSQDYKQKMSLLKSSQICDQPGPEQYKETQPDSSRIPKSEHVQKSGGGASECRQIKQIQEKQFVDDSLITICPVKLPAMHKSSSPFFPGTPPNFLRTLSMSPSRPLTNFHLQPTKIFDIIKYTKVDKLNLKNEPTFIPKSHHIRPLETKKRESEHPSCEKQRIFLKDQQKQERACRMKRRDVDRKYRIEKEERIWHQFMQDQFETKIKQKDDSLPYLNKRIKVDEQYLLKTDYDLSKLQEKGQDSPTKFVKTNHQNDKNMKLKSKSPLKDESKSYQTKHLSYNGPKFEKSELIDQKIKTSPEQENLIPPYMFKRNVKGRQYICLHCSCGKVQRKCHIIDKGVSMRCNKCIRNNIKMAKSEPAIKELKKEETTPLVKHEDAELSKIKQEDQRRQYLCNLQNNIRTGLFKEKPLRIDEMQFTHSEIDPDEVHEVSNHKLEVTRFQNCEHQDLQDCSRKYKRKRLCKLNEKQQRNSTDSDLDASSHDQVRRDSLESESKDIDGFIEPDSSTKQKVDKLSSDVGHFQILRQDQTYLVNFNTNSHNVDMNVHHTDLPKTNMQEALDSQEKSIVRKGIDDSGFLSTGMSQKEVTDQVNMIDKSQPFNSHSHQLLSSAHQNRSQQQNNSTETEEEDAENTDDNQSSDSSIIECICNDSEKRDHVICCDECQKWFHRKCIDMSRDEWRILGQQMNKKWLCPFCREGSRS